MIEGACAGRIAGKPAPTVGMRSPVGAGLARDEAGEANTGFSA